MCRVLRYRESVHFAVTHRTLGTSIALGNSTIALEMPIFLHPASVEIGNANRPLGEIPNEYSLGTAFPFA